MDLARPGQCRCRRPSALDRFSSPLYTVAEAARYLDVGAEVLYDYGETGEDEEAARAARELVVDPTRGFGQPIFARGGARPEDALALFRGGEPLDVVAEEYGVPRTELEDAVRIATRVAA